MNAKMTKLILCSVWFNKVQYDMLVFTHKPQTYTFFFQRIYENLFWLYIPYKTSFLIKGYGLNAYKPLAHVYERLILNRKFNMLQLIMLLDKKEQIVNILQRILQHAKFTTSLPTLVNNKLVNSIR